MNPWEEYAPAAAPPPVAAKAPWEEYSLSAGPAVAPPPINMNRESDMGVRAMAGLKLGAEGQANYLESRYGLGNVSTNKDGAFYVKEGEEWHPVDSPDFNTKDIADLSGTAVAAAPAIAAAAAGAVPATVLGTAAAGAGLGLLGSAAQQAVGALTPGGDPMPLGDRLTQTGLDTAFGGASELAGRGLSRLASAPKNAVVKQMGWADTPTTRESANIERHIGERFMPGQASQRNSLLTMEGMLRRSPGRAADVIAAKDKALLQAARSKWDQLLDQVHATPQSAELLGGQVTKAFDDTVKTATTTLDRQAAVDFAAVHSAAGQQPIFDLHNAAGALDGLLQQYDVPGAATDSVKGTVRQLHELRDSMVKPSVPGAAPVNGKRSASDMQRLLSSWGKAAAGKQTMFPDLGNRENISISKQVFGALKQDLDVAATVDPAVGGALKIARDNYKVNIGALEDIRKTAIGRYLGATEPGQLAPEAIAAKLQGMKPTQLRQTFSLLNSADPELAGATKRFMLEEVMTASQPNVNKIAERLGAGSPPEAYSPAHVLANLAKSPVLETLDQNEKFGVHMLSGAFQRMANRAGTDGSPTAPLMWWANVAKNIATTGLTADIMGAAQLAGTIFAPGKIADAITQPGMTRALVTLTQPNATREATIGAMTTLGLMGASRASNGQDVRPDAMPGQPGR